MKIPHLLSLVLCLSSLPGCALAPGENDSRLDMEEWCGRDESMPWTGCWTEVAQLDCASGQEIEPQLAIEEFRLTSEGSYSVTWSPFERYVDYAGPYVIDEETSTIELTMGKNAPQDADGLGEYAVTDQGELILKSIWLGARDGEDVEPSCGHTFKLKSRG